MKILHCCLGCFYIDNYNYQENILPRQNKLDGHNVSILASTETYVNGRELGYVEPRKYVNEDGIPVTRVAYKKVLNDFITRKFRSYHGVYKILEETNPDVIFFHDTCAWELLTVIKYVKKNARVKLLADSHADMNNSATNFFSKYILHRLFYGTITRFASRYIDKILCISYETQDFVNMMYGIPREKLEFFPLGGTVDENDKYAAKRNKIRTILGLQDNDILLVHSGKMDTPKRTADILKALSKVESGNIRLAILGTFSDDVRAVVEPMIKADSRVSYEGWKDSDELIEYLCAADMYVQPGSQSATMQNAICCRCAVMLYPFSSHEPYVKGNGYFTKTVEDMEDCFKRLVNQPGLLVQMSTKSLEIAINLLDYKKLAARLYQ